MRIIGPSLVSFLLLTSFFLLTEVDGRIEKPMAGPPDIQIIINEERVQVNVEPGNNGIVRFTGTVQCDMPPSTPPGQTCYVTLIADAGGWAFSLPDSMEFDWNHNQEDFTVSVQVPVETSSMVSGKLSISGKWRYSPGTLGGTADSSTAIIEILPYSQLQVSTDPDNNTVSVGGWGEIELSITNEGNVNDDIKLKLENIPDGIEAYLEDDLISVPEKQTKIVILKIQQPNGAPKTSQLNVIATGSYNGTRSSDTQPVVFTTTISVRSVFTTLYIIIPAIILLLIIGLIVLRKMMKRRKE